MIGVVKDIRYTSVRAPAPLVTYYSSRQQSSASASTFLIRTSGVSLESLVPLLGAEVRAAAPGLPPPSVITLHDQVASGLREERVLAALSSALGLLASVLAAIGIYSMVASAVARRRREIGVRIALGAVPRQIARIVIGDTFRVVAGGLVIGVPAALAAAVAARRAIGGVLFELSPTDPLILISVIASIALIASLAAYLPARRASRVDPVAALKYE